MAIQTNMVGVPVTNRGTWVQLMEGRIFYPLDPKAEDVFIEDIAQSLSRQIRFNGLSDEAINVAQHSCQCSWLADVLGHNTNIQFAMLMHDAPEYIVGDMIRPIKAEFPRFEEIEHNVMEVIIERFNLPRIDHTLMKYFDNIALSWEKRDMYKSARDWPSMVEVPDWCPTMKSWTIEYSKIRFLKLFEWLMLETGNRPH